MTRTNTAYSYEHANESTTTVKGETYTVWDDYKMRCTMAQNEDGETKRIRCGGYLGNDLSVRKAIARAFGLDSFRK